MSPMLLSGLIQGGGGILQIGQGLIQEAQAKKIARNNPRPTYRRPGEVDTNTDIAESRAGQGMSDSARSAMEQLGDRDLTSSIEAITKNGGNVNNIGDIYGHSISGRQRMSILDDEMRSRNIQNLVTANNEMAGYKDKEWEVNVFAPYADKAQAAAALRKQGNDNIWKGVNTVGSAAGNYFTGQQYKNEADRVFGEQSKTNHTYIDGTQPNNGIVPIGPHISGTQPPVGGEYNWRNFDEQNFTPPGQPQQQSQAPVQNQGQSQSVPYSPYGSLPMKYPGLLYGKF
jgi:hypothetical protein